METPQSIVEKKAPVKDLRAEIKELKGKMFINTAVMKADKLREYLDKLRYATNLIEAEDAMGHKEKKHLKDEHKKLEHHKKDVTDTESESDVEHEKKMMNVEKKVKNEIEKVKHEIKREKHLTKPEVAKEHKAEISHLDSIPKALHSIYKRHLKTHGGDHTKAKRELKKEMKF